MHVITVHDPFHPLRGREVREFRRKRCIKALTPKTDKPFVVLVDGQPVMRKDWDQTVSGDQIMTIVMLPQGGGGGGSNPLQVVLMIAVIVVSIQFGPEVGGLIGFSGATATAVGQALIMVGGSMLVNALAPPPSAGSGALGASSIPTASPTYNVQAQGNAARLGQAIPVQYGRMKVYPDFAAQPYVEYINNEQYLYQLFCVGQGDYDIEAVNIGDSAVSAFDNVSYQIISPNGRNYLFPSNVETSSEVAGQEVGSLAATYAKSGYTITVTATAHGLSVGTSVYIDFTSGAAIDGTYTIASVPTADTFTVTAGASSTSSGNAIVSNWLGPYVSNIAGTNCLSIGLDFVCPRGLYYANDNGSLSAKSVYVHVEAQAVDQSGSPVGSWQVLTADDFYSAWSAWGYYGGSTWMYPGSIQTTAGSRSAVYTQTAHGLSVGQKIYGYMPGVWTYYYGVITATTANTFTVWMDQAAPSTTYWPSSDYYTGLIPIPSDTDTAQYQWYDDGDSAYLQTRTRTVTAVDAYQITGATTTPIRRTLTYSVAGLTAGLGLGRFQVRVKRTDVKDTSTRAGHEVDWTGMRAYLPDQSAYGNVTMLAVKAQASNNLSNQAARQINVTCTRRLAGVTATGPSSTVSGTRSVAAAIADAAMNTTYGGSVAAANIDWAALYALDQTLAARGDYLDVRFDTASTLWDALTQIGAVARTKPYMQGGILHVARDQSASVPVALFSMRNIVQNSMSVQYMTPTSITADSVQVTYFDKATWQQATITCTLAGGTNDNPAKISLLGITERAQAYREGLYQAAANQYRRKVIKFSTECEGFIPSFGDLIAIQHDMPAWGQVGEVTAWNSGTRTLTVNEQLTWVAGQTHYVGLRKRDGSIDGPYQVTQGAAANILVLATSPGFTPYTGVDEERTHIAFGYADTWRQPARVVSVVPRGPYQVEITAVNEDPSVHTADTGVTAPALSYSELPKTNPLPVVSGLSVGIDVTGASPQYVANWNSAPGADHYVVEISWDGGSTWSALATEYGTTHRWAANRNASAYVRVAGVNLGRGAWATASVNYSSAPAKPSSLTATANSTGLQLTWTASADPDVVGYEARSSDSGWGGTGALFSGKSLTCPVTPPSAGSAQSYYVRAIDFLGNYSSASTTTSFTVSAPSQVAGVAAAVSGQALVLTWTRNASPLSTQFAVAQYEVRASDSGWGTTTGLLFKGDALTATVAAPAPGVATTYYVRAIDGFGNYSATSGTTTFTASAVPNVASVSWTFYATSTTSSTITLSWTDVAPQYGLDGYQVSYGSTTVVAKSNSITVPANWVGDRVFTVKTVDNNGNLSSGTPQTVTKSLPNSPTSFRAQVIDNTVMLYWGQPAVTTLPISHYLLRRGASWSSYDVDFGRKDGLFTTINETQGGNYTYWIATVDTDGNVSAASSVGAVVAQPPDFIFFGQFNSTFSGTKSSAYLENGALILAANTTETWAQHFTNHSWSSPQDQVNAGYPLFIQPSSASGYYEETFDFGTVLSSSRVTVGTSATVIAGSPNLATTISTSSDGVTWLDNPGSTQIYATAFRYVKVRLTVTDSAGTGLYQISAMSVTCDAKLKNDANMTSAVSTDTNGTIANFGKEFIDVTSITVTPQGTTPVLAVYDYKDAVITGTYSVTSNVCTVNATAHGLVVGQNVRLSFTTGTAPNGVYTVTSVPNANSYTVALTTANTSGNVSTYSQGLRIYLFNTSGTRVSGTASWSIKGY
jgi:sulfur carrier protein ThiS